GGLRVARGIVVDAGMRSVTDPAVYAVGECAEPGGRLYGLVGPAWEQAAVAAARITGADPDARYTGSSLVTRLKATGAELAAMGGTPPAGRGAGAGSAGGGEASRRGRGRAQEAGGPGRAAGGGAPARRRARRRPGPPVVRPRRAGAAGPARPAARRRGGHRRRHSRRHRRS